MADCSANDRWLELGYTQINMDDFWNTMQRIEYIAHYLHNLNLK